MLLLSSLTVKIFFYSKKLKIYVFFLRVKLQLHTAPSMVLCWDDANQSRSTTFCLSAVSHLYGQGCKVTD